MEEIIIVNPDEISTPTNQSNLNKKIIEDQTYIEKPTGESAAITPSLEQQEINSQDGESNDDTKFQQSYDPDYICNEKLKKLAKMDTTALVPLTNIATSDYNNYSIYNRLYISNLPEMTTTADMDTLLYRYGEYEQPYINNSKHFALVLFKCHENAKQFEMDYDFSRFKSNIIRVHFSRNSSTIRIRNLSNFTTNELLWHAFSVFGAVETARVALDASGEPSDEGFVTYYYKTGALRAVEKCTKNCYFLSSSLKPVIVELYRPQNNAIGFSDSHITKYQWREFQRERAIGPRLSIPGTFEHYYGMQWLALYDKYRQKEEALKAEFQSDCRRLQAQVDYARYEFQTAQLQKELHQREFDKEKCKRKWEHVARTAEAERIKIRKLTREHDWKLSLLRGDYDIDERISNDVNLNRTNDMTMMMNRKLEAAHKYSRNLTEISTSAAMVPAAVAPTAILHSNQLSSAMSISTSGMVSGMAAAESATYFWNLVTMSQENLFC